MRLVGLKKAAVFPLICTCSASAQTFYKPLMNISDVRHCCQEPKGGWWVSSKEQQKRAQHVARAFTAQDTIFPHHNSSWLQGADCIASWQVFQIEKKTKEAEKKKTKQEKNEAALLFVQIRWLRSKPTSLPM